MSGIQWPTRGPMIGDKSVSINLETAVRQQNRQGVGWF